MVGNDGYNYTGPGFRVLANQEEGSVALYRYYNPEVIDHFYTTNQAEINVTEVDQVGNYGYKLEGVLGYCFSNPTTGTKPLHRYYNKELNDRFYTIYFEGNARYEGIQCYVYPAQAEGSRIRPDMPPVGPDRPSVGPDRPAEFDAEFDAELRA